MPPKTPPQQTHNKDPGPQVNAEQSVLYQTIYGRSVARTSLAEMKKNKKEERERGPHPAFYTSGPALNRKNPSDTD